MTKSRRILAILIGLVSVGILFNFIYGQTISDKLRVIIETDIGNDPDDQASFVRFLMYANEWDIEGIIATQHETTGSDGYGGGSGFPGHTGHWLANHYIDRYGEIVNNLKLHDSDYPSASYLKSITKDGVHNPNSARDLVIAAVDSNDPRPVYFLNWGTITSYPDWMGVNDLSAARLARDHVKATRSASDFVQFMKKIYLIAQPKWFSVENVAGLADIMHEVGLAVDTFFPDQWYASFDDLTWNAGGFDVNADVKNNHGPLAALYTNQKEGDTPTFLMLIPNGLLSHSNPTWGGWAGRSGFRDQDFIGPNIYWMNVTDTWQGHTNRDNTLLRYAEHLQNDFKARLDWGVKTFAEANHEPIPQVVGSLHRTAVSGSVVTLDANGSSDPDGNSLSYEWLYFPEASTYGGVIPINNKNTRNATFTAPTVAADKTIHVILVVTDNGEPNLTRYKRVVVTVTKDDPIIDPPLLSPPEHVRIVN